MQGVRCVKKKKPLNKKGFMLLETLIVSIFVMTIFAMLYTNLFPLLGIELMIVWKELTLHIGREK